MLTNMVASVCSLYGSSERARMRKRPAHAARYRADHATGTSSSLSANDSSGAGSTSISRTFSRSQPFTTENTGAAGVSITRSFSRSQQFTTLTTDTSLPSMHSSPGTVSRREQRSKGWDSVGKPRSVRSPGSQMCGSVTRRAACRVQASISRMHLCLVR